MADTTRRQVLKYTPSIIAVLAGTELDVREALESDQAAQEATTATLSIDDTSQYRGGPKNQGNKERSDGKSPKSVNEVNELGTLSKGQFEGPPVTTPGGQYGVQGENVAVIAYPEADSFIELDASGLTSPLVFFGEERASFGDSAGIKEIDAETGNQLKIIEDFPGAAAGAYAKHNGKAYKGRSNATEEIDTSTFDSNELDNTNSTGPGNFLLLDNGQTSIRLFERDLIRYDIDSETEVEKNEGVDALPTGLSSDGDYIFAGSSDYILAYDAESLDRVSRASKDGISGSSPAIIKEENKTEVYSTETRNGVVKAYDFEDEEFTHQWDFETEGSIGNLVAYEDVIIGAGTEKTVGINKEIGEKEWEVDVAGDLGTPYDDKIPIAGFDDTLYELEMEMEELGDEEDCINRRYVSRSDEEQGCYSSEREAALDELEDRFGPRDEWSRMTSTIADMALDLLY